ncbi:MAG: hypothetical protein HY051_06265 [Candidatus Aenigmarchaeota archaeon]|nr:hypothetical protein [Candidatus Aenigmarchaeota archaeon]
MVVSAGNDHQILLSLLRPNGLSVVAGFDEYQKAWRKLMLRGMASRMTLGSIFVQGLLTAPDLILQE